MVSSDRPFGIEFDSTSDTNPHLYSFWFLRNSWNRSQPSEIAALARILEKRVEVLGCFVGLRNLGRVLATEWNGSRSLKVCLGDCVGAMAFVEAMLLLWVGRERSNESDGKTRQIQHYCLQPTKSENDFLLFRTWKLEGFFFYLFFFNNGRVQ